MNFHESYQTVEVKPPRERNTGLTLAAAAMLLAVVWRDRSLVPWLAACLGATLAIVSLAAPSMLRPLNVVWFRFGLLLHRIVNPIVMLALFTMVILPAGLLMRIWYDPLRRKRLSVTSYWVDVRDEIPSSMKNQF